MVEQGDIILINFEPIVGHEQGRKRPAVVISNNEYNKLTQLVVVCPISSSAKNFPTHIPLDERTKTQGVVLCQHIRTLDINSRGYKFFEKIPPDILEKVKEIYKLII